jgi:hypothetical protein
MAYGSGLMDVVQSSTAGVAPQFNDGNGTQTGTLCRAWVNYKGTATQSVRASFNVSSVTRNSAGNYTINFSNALSDANYIGVGSCSVDLSGVLRTINIPYSSAQTTTALRFVTCNSAGTAEDQDYINVAVFR